MKATLSALLCLSLAACGGTSKPAPTGPTPPPTGDTTAAGSNAPATGDVLELGELKLVDANHNSALQIHADGSIEIDGQKPAKVTKDGKIVRADNGQVGFTLGSDGSVKGPDGQDLGVNIGADGSVKAGSKTISIDASGNISDGSAQPVQMRVEGATTPGLKRTAMFVLVALTAPSGEPHEGPAVESAPAPAPAPAPPAP